MQATKKAGEEIKKVFQILDSHLSTRTYLVGNRVSVADIVVASSLVRLFELVCHRFIFNLFYPLPTTIKYIMGIIFGGVVTRS